MQATENKVLTFADFAILVRTQNMTLAFENGFFLLKKKKVFIF